MAEKPANHLGRNFCTETAESIAEERKLNKENAANGFFNEGGKDEASSNLLDGLFTSQWKTEVHQFRISANKLQLPWMEADIAHQV